MTSVVIKFPERGCEKCEFDDMVDSYKNGEYVALFVVATTKSGSIERIEITRPFADRLIRSQ